MEKPPSLENLEAEIERLLGELDRFALDQFAPEVQDALSDEWYDVEMEAKVGADRQHAYEHLKMLVEKLERTPKVE